MIIQAKIRSVYGNDLIYIIDPMIAQAISRITGKKTIDRRNIQEFKNIGVIIEIQ
jgi:hypothetical protein